LKLIYMNLFKNYKNDLPASIVVFFVAIPLCLGIAMASGAPLISGLIAGVIGGIVVGSISGSPLGVSGPAAGLAVIVLTAIQDLGAFEIFLVAVIIAGILQIIMGYAKAGNIAYFFPSSVIFGMLAGIGIIIFLKQVPHAFGYDRNPEGALSFKQVDGENTFSELINMLNYISPGALIIAGVSLAILLLWETKFLKQFKIFQLVQGPLVAVISGVILNLIFANKVGYQLRPDQIVNVPVAASMDDFFSSFMLPDFTALTNPAIYVTAVVIAVVASLETLLCVEATDKLDPYKRITPTNRELKAQGVGNILSALIGGLPVTQVIVRSSANIQAGGKSKASAIVHGLLLLVSIMLIPDLLNMIPLATLAAILFVVGYKLAKPEIFKKMYSQGMGQFIPFIITILGIVFIDLLWGLGIGLAVAILVILRNNYNIPFKLSKELLEGKDRVTIELAQEVSFLNKASILKAFDNIADNTYVKIDASRTNYMHYDVEEIISNFIISAKQRNIQLEIIDLHAHSGDIPSQPIRVKTNGK
jgi:MFS superfamily sulfate permease-like transporter